MKKIKLIQEPNCSGGDQYCVKQQSDQTFNDFWCYYQFQYACEYGKIWNNKEKNIYIKFVIF